MKNVKVYFDGMVAEIEVADLNKSIFKINFDDIIDITFQRSDVSDSIHAVDCHRNGYSIKEVAYGKKLHIIQPIKLSLCKHYV